jgi:hypothetical protein
LRYNRSNSPIDPYAYATNDTAEFGAEPEAAKHFIPADGKWVVDRENPQMATGGTRFSKNTPIQKVRPDVEKMTPSARDVGKVRWRKIKDDGKEEMIPALICNQLLAWWIQVQVHNIAGNTMRCPVLQNPYIIPRAPEDNWPDDVARIDRTMKDPTRVTDDGRPTVINERTIAWVQSQIYGTNEAEEKAVRSFEGGKLKVDNRGRLPEDPKQPGIDLTGFNNNFSAGTSFMHCLLASEHNYIADYYRYFHPDWNDEKVFQMARKALCAKVARVHTEWTKDLLQHPALQLAMGIDWSGIIGKRNKLFLMRLADRHPLVYRLLTPLRHNDFLWGMPGSKWEHHSGPNQIQLEFRMVYRLHELVPSEIVLFDPATGVEVARIPIAEFIGKHTRSVVDKHGYPTIAYSAAIQSCGALTLKNFPRGLTKFHNQKDGELTDLAERDIFREREDGTGTYNEFRESLGDPPVTSFMELTGGDAELARELEVLYEYDIDKVDPNIGILAEPRPKGNALSYSQLKQFVGNAIGRLKNNRFLSEGYTYAEYLEGLDYVEHSGGMLEMMARHMPELAEKMEGVERAFGVWKDPETFAQRMLKKTQFDTDKVYSVDLRTLLLGCATLAAAVMIGALTLQVAAIAAAALAIAPLAQTARRMLAMNFMRQVWQNCYTDKRDTMFGTLYKGELWINISAICGGVQSLLVMCAFSWLGWAIYATQPWVALLAALTSLSGLSIWKWSARFAQDAQILKIALRERMRKGKSVIRAASFNCEKARYWLSVDSEEQFERMLMKHAPGRDCMTPYDFERLHEENRVNKKRGILLTALLLPWDLACQWFAQMRTDKLLAQFADRTPMDSDEHQFLPAVSREMLLRLCDGSAEHALKREKEKGDCDPSPLIIRN